MHSQVQRGISLIVLPLPSERAGERLFFPHFVPSNTMGNLANCSPSPFGEGWGEASVGCVSGFFPLITKNPKGLGEALRGCFITRKDCLFRQKRESVTVLRGEETKSLYASPFLNHLKRSHYLLKNFISSTFT